MLPVAVIAAPFGMCTSSKNTNTREVGRVANGNARYRLAVPPVQERPPVFTLGPDADLTEDRKSVV